MIFNINLEEFDIHYSSVCNLKNICLSHFPYLKRIYIGGYCISESTNIEIDNCNKLRDIELGLKGIERSSYHSTEWKGELIISNCLVLKKLIIKSDKLVHTKGSITLQSIFLRMNQEIDLPALKSYNTDSFDASHLDIVIDSKLVINILL